MMNNEPMNDSTTSLHGILEIEPPQAPMETGSAITFWPLLGVLCIALIAGYIGWRRYRSPGQRARRLQREVARDFREQHIDAREVAFRLAATLHHALPEASHSHTPVSGSHTSGTHDSVRTRRWEEFQQALTLARYAREPSGIDPHYLLQEAQYWLRRAR